MATYINGKCNLFNKTNAQSVQEEKQNDEKMKKLYGNDVNVVHKREVTGEDKSPEQRGNGEKCESENNGDQNTRSFKGFKVIEENSENVFYTQHSQSRCFTCPKCQNSSGENKVFHDIAEFSSAACDLKENASHIELAQLILWRENAGKEYERNYFRVGINGSSGPAILGLSLLNENNNDDDKEQYFSLVKHAASYYLSTVLYCYFLPFLSEKDIERIHNGMYMFVHSMKATSASPFALNEKYDKWGIPDKYVSDVIKLVPEVLLTVLKGFRGMEVFYQVQVEGSTEEGGTKENNSLVFDTRIIKKIDMLKEMIKRKKKNYLSITSTFRDGRSKGGK